MPLGLTAELPKQTSVWGPHGLVFVFLSGALPLPGLTLLYWSLGAVLRNGYGDDFSILKYFHECHHKGEFGDYKMLNTGSGNVPQI